MVKYLMCKECKELVKNDFSELESHLSSKHNIVSSTNENYVFVMEHYLDCPIPTDAIIATIHWSIEDLYEAFKESGIRPTLENVELFLSHRGQRAFSETLTNNGWEILESAIEISEYSGAKYEKADGFIDLDALLEYVDNAGHACICKDCAVKFFGEETALAEKTGIEVMQEYFLDTNCADGAVCEMDLCNNDADFTVSSTEDIDND